MSSVPIPSNALADLFSKPCPTSQNSVVQVPEAPVARQLAQEVIQQVVEQVSKDWTAKQIDPLEQSALDCLRRGEAGVGSALLRDADATRKLLNDVRSYLKGAEAVEIAELAVHRTREEIQRSEASETPGESSSADESAPTVGEMFKNFDWSKLSLEDLLLPPKAVAVTAADECHPEAASVDANSPKSGQQATPEGSHVEPRDRESLPSDLPLPQPDGPFGLSALRYLGKDYDGLTPSSFRLLRHLWHAPAGVADFRDLGEPVFEDHAWIESTAAVSSIAKRLRKFFRSNYLPLQVKVSRRRVQLIRRDAPESEILLRKVI